MKLKIYKEVEASKYKFCFPKHIFLFCFCFGYFIVQALMLNWCVGPSTS